jgi:hypothetical protein
VAQNSRGIRALFAVWTKQNIAWLMSIMNACIKLCIYPYIFSKVYVEIVIYLQCKTPKSIHFWASLNSSKKINFTKHKTVEQDYPQYFDLLVSKKVKLSLEQAWSPIGLWDIEAPTFF